MSSIPESQTTLRTSRKSWLLKNQLLASHLGLVLLSVVLFGSVLFGTSLHSTYRRAESDLLAVAQEMVHELGKEKSPNELSISELYKHRFGMAPRDHAYIAVWGPAGNLLYATPERPVHAMPTDRLPPNHGPHPYHVRATGLFLDLMIATPQEGQLLIGRPLSKEWDGLLWLLARIFGLGILSVFVSGLIALAIAKRIASPLSQLVDTTKRISARRLQERISVDTGSMEIVQLSSAMNEMLERIQDAFEKQTRFIADASHELRTPVAIVLSQTEHALYRERSSESYRDSLQVCLKSSKRMKRLIDELLFLARVDAGRIRLQTNSVSISELVSQHVELMRPLAMQRGIELIDDLQPAMAVVDRERIGQVVTNLISNAIRYNKDRGQIRVATRMEGEFAILEVSDSGIGIPPQAIPRLFDRFYQVDEARTHSEEAGTGLGLSLVYEIITAHHGTIDVNSILGEGTTFTVRIPLTAAINADEKDSDL